MDHNGTRENLARRTHDLLRSLSVPTLAPFLADWPDLADPRASAPHIDQDFQSQFQSKERHFVRAEYLMKERSIMVAASGLLIAAMAGLANADDDATNAPEALKAPAGQVLALSAHAAGVQIYACTADKDDPTRFSWTLKAPEAALRDKSGKPLGKHYAGPTWEATDGSKVIGDVVAKDAGPNSAAIPWLLLRAKSTSGTGVFSAVASIQRLRTVGGKAPANGCDQAQSGKETRVPYSAEYLFYTAQP